MPTRETVPVTVRALVQRINRRLAQDDATAAIRAVRGRARHDLGHFVLIRKGKAYPLNASLEKYARDLGVMERWESIVE